jgi:arabinofuranosyltransferase
LVDSVQRDPVTSVAIVLLAGYCAAQPGVTRWLAFGSALYLLYVAFIGGDFMSGRFHGAPLLLLGTSALSALELRQTAEPAHPDRNKPQTARDQAQRRLLAAAVAALVLYALVWPASPLRATASYGAGWSLERTFSAAGVGDERAYYYPTTGLLPVAIAHDELVERALPIPPDHKAVQGTAFARSVEQAAFNEAVGFFGFYADRKPVIDILGLADPLLARIPFRSSAAFRPGHYERMLPAGYLQSRRTDGNLLQDADLREAYAQLRLITGGALWDAERWRAIWRLNTGYYRAAFTRAAVDLASVP